MKWDKASMALILVMGIMVSCGTEITSQTPMQQASSMGNTPSHLTPTPIQHRSSVENMSGCSTPTPAQGKSSMENTPSHLTPTPMQHRSSMGDIPSQWHIEEIPVSFRGDWLLRPLDGSSMPAEYRNLVFRLTRSPSDCRVLQIEDDGSLREIGTMPLAMFADTLYAYFVGEFHLTMDLQIREVEDRIEGTFTHAGSGAVYYDGAITLIRYKP